MDRTFEFKGAGKTVVRIGDNFIRLKRRGALNFLNHGLDGEKPLILTI
ncbi:hypothetical protein P4H06_32205 [Bacillus cereus]|nr:hypothetical protein [Bacillus thuringiensis]MEB8860917.1 hypothetical protein [Bacillus cereus]MEB9423392.1 hypothetical protein [Bacillus cereus]MEC2467191.1 hypothetical protein [Bacillus cereus]